MRGYGRSVTRVAVLPTRDGVLLPGAFNELNVGRPGSVAALRYAAEREERVLVLLQRDPEVDAPKQTDLFEVGTLCRVTDAQRVSSEAACVGVIGVKRVRVTSMEQRGDALVAEVESIGWQPAAPEMPERLRVTLPFLLAHGLPGREASSDLARLCLLSVVSPLRPEQLQGVLETADLAPVVAALDSLRDRSWLARFLRWVRRVRK